ncbi:hypothetical protein Tco_0387239, partial [Tanacetum coccineum]
CELAGTPLGCALAIVHPIRNSSGNSPAEWAEYVGDFSVIDGHLGVKGVAPPCGVKRQRPLRGEAAEPLAGVPLIFPNHFLTSTIVTTPAVPATENSPAVPEQTTVETVMNMTPENRAHFESEKEAIHLILTGIGDEIYSTVDACQTAQEMWEAIERLQQEWSRFVTIVKQQHKLDEVSYHKLFDILKQYQKEVNELRAERMAKNANPLALVATAQTLQDPYYQSSKSHKSYAPTSKASLPTRSHATTRYKGKEIAKPITPPSESASEEDSDPKQAQRDKDM